MGALRIRAEDIKDLLRMLWAARLLGWLPKDIEWMSHRQLVEITTEGSKRPLDVAR